MLFENVPWPSSGMSEPAPHRAVAAVGSHEVASANRAFGTVVAPFHDRGHAFGVRLERHELGAVLEARAELLDPLPQNRLEADLRDEDSCRRAQILDALVDVPEVPVDLAASEGLDRHDRAVLDELPARGLDDLVLDARAAVQLDGSLIDERGTRMNGRTTMPLDDQRGNPVLSEEQRRRQADQTAAGDQDGYVVIAHDSAPALVG